MHVKETEVNFKYLYVSSRHKKVLGNVNSFQAPASHQLILIQFE